MAGRKLWVIVGGLWLILYGILAITNVTVTGAAVVLGFGALLWGILLLLDR